MFFVRFIQQVLHSLRDSDAMIRKARSFPTRSSVNGSIQWPNRLWLSWSQSAPSSQTNVQIEPLLFHFLRTSFIVHAWPKCYERSSFKKTRCFRERSKKSKRKRTSFCFGQRCYSRFPSFYCRAIGVRFLSATNHKHQTLPTLTSHCRRAGKCDCSPWATESNWQLLNQSCDDIVMKWMKKIPTATFLITRARPLQKK